MKKLLLIALIGLFVLGASTTAMAVVIPPSTLSTGVGPTITTPWIKQLLNTPFTGVSVSGTAFTGTLTQTVYLEPTGLLFTYVFTNAAGSRDPISTLTTDDFTGFITDVNVGGAAGDWMFRRNTPSTIGFDNLVGGISGGNTTSTLWIQTDARYLAWGSTNLIDGAVASVRTYAPTAIPEPLSMSLLGLGVLGLLGLRRRKA